MNDGADGLAISGRFQLSTAAHHRQSEFQGIIMNINQELKMTVEENQA